MPGSLPYEIVAFQRIDGLAQVRGTGALHDPILQPLEESRRPSPQWVSLPGPVKWVRAILVPLGDVAVEGMSELVDPAEAGVLEAFPLQETEPDFHLIEPGGEGWGEVKNKAPVVSTIPVASLRAIVCVQIIQHQMDLPAGVGLCDPVQVSQEIRLLPGRVTPAQHLPSAHIEASKQARRAVADVLTFDKPSIPVRRCRYGLKPLQRLNTG